jgi:hypothetical protein
MAISANAGRFRFTLEAAMPVLRIVYASLDTGRVGTLTAGFASGDEARAAMAAAGFHVLQIAPLRPGERLTDPILVPMAAAATSPVREARARRAPIGSFSLTPAR